jgi:hypothetical protein
METTVLVRGYGDEPGRLTAVAYHARKPYLTVYGRDPDRTVGWRLADAYAWDEALHGRLRAAFDAGDREALAALWAEARPFAVPDGLPREEW